MAKIALQDFIKYGKLFDVYGKLLSADRQRIMSAYFEYNMTLAEIAKEKNISRQAVLDAIDKACQKLDEYEVALKFGARNEKISRRLNDLLHEDYLDDVKKKIEEIIKEILWHYFHHYQKNLITFSQSLPKEGGLLNLKSKKL